MKLIIILIKLMLIVNKNYAFNISPKPNLIINEPSLISYTPKERFSLFGFSIVLKSGSVFVGAPRAQSSLESQRKVNESGAIYKCSLQNGQCAPYIFDKFGNQNFENNEYTWNSEKKDFQWLGGSMDGGSNDNERLIVCAPRLCADVTKEYLMHGVCYWTPNTFDDQPTNITRIAPLRLKSEQVKEDGTNRYFYYMFGEQGLSVHWTGINEEILIGAPGLHTWKGSMVRHRLTEQEDIGGLSKRDTYGTRIPRQATSVLTNEVLSPELWDQPNDSYFGYSVGSGIFGGNDSTKLLYIASAPQAYEQAGEVYIFDIVKKSHNRFSIYKYQTFHGEQLGEYFGYNVLSEDLNGDGWTDLIVSAPLYATGIYYEKGAIYVFINKGNFQFELQLIVSPSDEPGRFGTTVTKLSDINHDGYNDLAIGAPFDGNGKVYIYLGSPNGLQLLPSQILKAPVIKSFDQRHMFGHGLSRGVDIDSNQYPDLAIGAPNAETVYIYKAYPVVKVFASIGSNTREIKTGQTKLQIQACYNVESTSQRSSTQDLNIKIKIDPQVKRVKFPDGSDQMEFNVTASQRSECRLYDANVKFSPKDIFKPIELEMHYDLIYKIPDSEVFCERCAALDPSTPGVTMQKISFSTGCKSEICVADLKLTSSGTSSSFVLGSSRTLTVNYDIVNDGESAYLPQINITSSNRMPFAKIPSTCTRNEFFLVCDLNLGQPMHKDDKESLTIIFDTSNIEGTSMRILAEVFSTGGELNSGNNIVVNTIQLQEFSSIEVSSNTPPLVSLEEFSNSYEFNNKFEIQNVGPSAIKQIEIILSIPISYIIPNSKNRINLIDINNFTITGTYSKNTLNVELYQNNSLLILNSNIDSTTKKSYIVENLNTNYYPLEQDSVIIEDDQQYNNNFMFRRKRAIEMQATDAEYAKISKRKLSKSSSDELLGTLPLNRTITFNCNNPDETLCVQAKFRVSNFKPDNDEMISINVKYNVDLNEIDKILIDDKEFFVITSDLNIMKIGDEKGDTIDVQKSIPHNIISKHQMNSTPIWVIIVSILAGILLLVLIVYGLYKLGFFKRSKKEEMETLTRNSQRQEDNDETEDEE